MESQGRETWLATFRFVFGVQVPCEEEGVLKCSQHIDPADPLAGISGPRLGKDRFERLAHRPLRTAVKGTHTVIRLPVVLARCRLDHMRLSVSIPKRVRP